MRSPNLYETTNRSILNAQKTFTMLMVMDYEYFNNINNKNMNINTLKVY